MLAIKRLPNCALRRAHRVNLKTKSLSLRALSTVPKHLTTTTFSPRRPVLPKPFLATQTRAYARKSLDDHIQNVEYHYAQAEKTYSLAAEETNMKSVYAADDRAAAHDQLDALIEAYEDALEELGPGADKGGRLEREWGTKIEDLEGAIIDLGR